MSIVIFICEKMQEFSLLEILFPIGFNYEYFKRLSLPEKRQYAFEKLEKLFLGNGAARDVYRLSSKKVLKIARATMNRTTWSVEETGKDQNKNECRIYMNANQAIVVLPKIYFCDSDGSFLIAEFVKEFKTKEEFFNASGILWRDFIRAINLDDSSKHNLIQNFIYLIKNLNLHEGEFVLEHFGKTSDGRVVMLDTGFVKN